MENCTKCGQLTVSKIIKIVAISCQILRLKCIKFDFGWGSVPHPAGGDHSASPDPLFGLHPGPGLYPGPGVYPGHGYYPGIYSKCLRANFDVHYVWDMTIYRTGQHRTTHSQITYTV